jgi:hypothetical protein
MNLKEAHYYSWWTANPISRLMRPLPRDAHPMIANDAKRASPLWFILKTGQIFSIFIFFFFLFKKLNFSNSTFKKVYYRKLFESLLLKRKRCPLSHF